MRLRENFQTRAKAIAAKAGVETWPRFWQNLRSSCETDLATRFPVHVACSWIGNSVGVAMRHYLQITDEHFAMANTGAPKRSKPGAKTIQKTHETYSDTRPQQTDLLRGLSLEKLEAAAALVQSALGSAKRRLAKSDHHDLKALANASKAKRRAL